MLSCTLLLKLPSEWQLKMHNEILSKLKLCIPDLEIAKNLTNDTWRYLSQDNLSKNELSIKLKPHLTDHASDFSEWVLDFAQKTIEYYLETVSSTKKIEGTCKDENLKGKDNYDKFKGKVEKKTTLLSESNSRMLRSVMKDISKEKFKVEEKVDPLDDTLDNLIKKEKIAKLQGQTNPSLGVKTRSNKFKQIGQEQDNRKKFKSKNSFFKNLTLVNPDQNIHNPYTEQPPQVTKVPKLCINFPNCQFGENCRYIHPNNKICKNWPNCFFGQKCAFIHPNN